MWMPRIIRKHREKLASLQHDADERSDLAAKLAADAERRAARSARIAARSRELAEQNTIAPILASALRIPLPPEKSS